MKKLLLILLCLPLIFNSCSKEDDETIQPNNTSALSIDINLVGEWIKWNSNNYDYYIFGSNGEYCSDLVGGSGCGNWWSENNKIMFSYQSINHNTTPYSVYTGYSQSDYIINGNELIISGDTLLKQ
jgi:hypothetical protein